MVVSWEIKPGRQILTYDGCQLGYQARKTNIELRWLLAGRSSRQTNIDLRWLPAGISSRAEQREDGKESNEQLCQLTRPKIKFVIDVVFQSLLKIELLRTQLNKMTLVKDKMRF